MLEAVIDPISAALLGAFKAVVIPLPFFVLLAIILKGRRLFPDIKRAIGESRINLLIHFTDAILVAPILVVLSVVMEQSIGSTDLVLVPSAFWAGLHPAVVAFAALFVGDFISYWRHRLEHTPLLWPSHAIHHSDTEMTWLAIFRFHPINRFTTTITDYAFLLMMGFPPYALLANSIVRHYYGALIHADLPWTYGPLGHVFVSPAMHRWHHAMDPKAYNTNYATVFSLFDTLFGTFRVPGKCDVPLGVAEKMGTGLVGQLAHPFKATSYRYLLRRNGLLGSIFSRTRSLGQ